LRPPRTGKDFAHGHAGECPTWLGHVFSSAPPRTISAAAPFRRGLLARYTAVGHLSKKHVELRTRARKGRCLGKLAGTIGFAVWSDSLPIRLCACNPLGSLSLQTSRSPWMPIVLVETQAAPTILGKPEAQSPRHGPIHIFSVCCWIVDLLLTSDPRTVDCSRLSFSPLLDRSAGYIFGLSVHG